MRFLIKTIYQTKIDSNIFIDELRSKGFVSYKKIMLEPLIINQVIKLTVGNCLI